MGLSILLACVVSLLAHGQIQPPTCFSPKRDCAKKLAGFIDQSKATLDIAVYDINEPAIVQAINSAKARGVQVRIAVDKRQSMGPHSKVKELIQAKLAVKYGVQSGIMHNKFVIVDHAEIETGSFNYTNHADKGNHENQLYVSDKSIVDSYQREFEDIWSSAKTP